VEARKREKKIWTVLEKEAETVKLKGETSLYYLFCNLGYLLSVKCFDSENIY
jgi:hypothetical protein